MIAPNSIQPGTVSVLIGPNGSGKSRLLRKLCTEFLHNGDEVIAIAPTIYDRFRRMPKRGLKFFGARQEEQRLPGSFVQPWNKPPQKTRKFSRILPGRWNTPTLNPSLASGYRI